MATVVFNTGKFVEKIMALASYDNDLLFHLYKNPINKQKINRGAAFLVKNYFNQYIDARARQNSRAYHHVYEFDKTGDSEARLFKCNVTSTPDGSAVINYNFTQSKEPNRYGYVFLDKAEVMEKNNRITITPKNQEYLQYALEDGQFVKTKKSVVENPGGKEVANSFENTFNRFMVSQPGVILKKFGFFERIEQTMIQKRKLSIPRINSGMISSARRMAKLDADSISQGV